MRESVVCMIFLLPVEFRLTLPVDVNIVLSFHPLFAASFIQHYKGF